MTKKVGQAMLNKGMASGDIALYSTNNITKIYVLIFGVWRIGGCMHSSYCGETAGHYMYMLI
jgi:hypothetical protein